MKPLKVTDKELVARALEGQSEAFAGLVERYRDAAYAIALHVLGEPVEAAQAAQDAFIRAYQNLAQLKNPARFAPWLCRIAQNRARSYLAAKRAAPQLASLEDVEDKAAGQRSPREDAEKSEVTNLIRRLMQRLPDEQRLTFTLFYINGYSERDVSGMLSVPVGTVKSRLSHARARLKKEVVKMADEVLKGSRPDAEFWRSATGAMAGRVTSAATGEPVKGVRVDLYELGTHTGACATSKPDGTWDAQCLLPGAYFISASHPEFVREAYRARRWGSVRVSAIVRPGQAVRGIDFRLQPGARIEGKVIDPNGGPVAGAEISVWRAMEPVGEVRFEQVCLIKPKTDEQGRFSVGYLPKGACRVGVQVGKKVRWAFDRPLGYYPGTLSFHDAEWVEASPSKHQELTIHLVEEGTARLSVEVMEAETGKPLGGAHVLVNRRDANWDMFEGYGDENGLFETHLLTPGPFQVTLDAHHLGFARWSKWVDVGPMDRNVEMNFRLPKGAGFGGRIVTQDGSELPALKSFFCTFTPARPSEMDGRPIKVTDVSSSGEGSYLAHGEGPQPEQIRGVHEDGRFASPPVWPGRVNIWASLYDKDWRVVSVSVGRRATSSYECKPGERVTDVEIVLGTNLGVVAGRVVSADGNTPIEGGWVHLWGKGQTSFHPLPIETDRSGSFLFQGVPAGAYVLAIARSRSERPIESTKREITVEPGGVVHLDLTLCGG